MFLKLIRITETTALALPLLLALASLFVAFGESLSVIREIKKSKKQSLFVLFFVLRRNLKT